MSAREGALFNVAPGFCPGNTRSKRKCGREGGRSTGQGRMCTCCVSCYATSQSISMLRRGRWRSPALRVGTVAAGKLRLGGVATSADVGVRRFDCFRFFARSRSTQRTAGPGSGGGSFTPKLDARPSATPRESAVCLRVVPRDSSRRCYVQALHHERSKSVHISARWQCSSRALRSLV